MNQVKKAIRITLASILLILGLVGLVLPILNGLILILLGLILLSFESLYIDEYLKRMTSKNTFIHTIYEKLYRFMRKIFS